MHNATTHYQTSFKVENTDREAFSRLKAAVYGWVLKKERNPVLHDQKADFLFRCHWPDLFQTHSTITTETCLNDKEGNAWAMRYKEIDGDVGPKRFWYSDIGLKEAGAVVVVSVRISYAWNTEYLSREPEAPHPSVPKVIRYMLAGSTVFSGRAEFRLIEKPIHFLQVGEGKALCDFIQSAERRYPLIVFNGNSEEHVKEANRLAWDLTGKCQVAVIDDNDELDEEIQHYLHIEYRVQANRMRVYFPFNSRRNTPERHRWYNIHRAEYSVQREGIIHGLLRHHSLIEADAVESVDDVKRLIARENLLRVKPVDPEQQKTLVEFLEEHAKVALERDHARNEAVSYANQVDDLEKENNELKSKVDGLQARLAEADQASEVENAVGLDTAKLLPRLPRSLADVVKMAKSFFPCLIITEGALDAAEKYPECKSFGEAWEMLHCMNEVLFRLKFTDGEKDLERAFHNETGYELSMTKGPKTKQDKKLMKLRTIVHCGSKYDITPHLKHGNVEPKLVRIYFAFDEKRKNIVVGHIGQHIPNATSKTK